MMDLIYAGKDAEEVLKKKYPEAKIIDASDYIHTERFEFHLELEDDKVPDEYVIFLLESGLYNCSFHFGMLASDSKGRIKLNKILQKIKEKNEPK